MRRCDIQGRSGAKRTARAVAAIEHLEDRLLLYASPPGIPAASVTNPITIDLLAAYTPQARDAAGSDAAAIACIQSDIADINKAMADSLVYVTLRLVGTTLLSYDDTGDLTTDLFRVQNPTDGQMDNIVTLRTQLGADLVALYTATPDPLASNLAYLMDNPNAVDNDAYGYCTLLIQPVGPRYALAQAIGFNLGATLDRDSTSTPGAYAYSYGYRFTIEGSVYRDIMSRSPGTQLPYFSNPSVSYQGVPIGASDDSPSPSNVARTLNQNAPVVAAYRTPDTTPPQVSAVSAADIVAASAAARSFTVTYSDNVAISVVSLGTSDILVTGPGGYSQIATFVSVDTASDGTPRTATYRVTGPGGSWDFADNGTYTIRLRASQVFDTAGNAAASRDIAVFQPQNLTPGRHAAWSDTLPVSTTPDPAAATPARIYVDQAVYVSLGVSAVATPQVAFVCTLRLDGQVVASPQIQPQQFLSGLASVLNINLGTLAAGSHTLVLTVDSGNAIAETSEADNTFTRQFTVYARPTLLVQYGASSLSAGQTVNLGEAILGTPAPAATLSIRNNGAGDLLLSTPQISGAFQMSSSPSLSIPPGGVSDLVAIMPTTALGGKNGQIVLTTNDPAAQTFTINLLGIVSPPPPDLSPTTPAGWSSSLVVATGSAATADSELIYDNQTVYLSLAWRNLNSDTSVSADFLTAIYVDDQLVATIPTTAGAANAGAIQHQGISIGQLSPGLHSVRFAVDSAGTVPESNESNNVVSRSVLITPRPVPRLTVTFGGQSVQSGQVQPLWLGSGLVGQPPAGQPLVVQNTGNATLSITSIDVPAGFVLAGDGSFSLEPGASVNVTVQLTAQLPGDFAGAVVLAGNDPQTPEFTVPVCGTVFAETIPPARLTVWEGGTQIDNHSQPVELGRYTTGQVSDIHVVLLRNDGIQDLHIASITLPDGFSLLSPAPTRLTAGESAALSVRLLTDLSGEFAGTALIVSDDPENPEFAFALHGVVVNATPNLQPYRPDGWPAALVVSTAPDTSTDAWPIYDDQALFIDLAIRNTIANAPLDAGFDVLIRLDGNVLAMFTVTPEDLAAGFSGVVSWSDLAAGPLGAGEHVLRVDVDGANVIQETDDADNVLTRTISVLARPQPQMSVSFEQSPLANNISTPIDAGTVLVGQTARTLTFSIANPGNAALIVSNIDVPGGYLLLRSPAPIAPGSSDTISLRMDSQYAGHPQGTLSFATNVPGLAVFTIPLTGTVNPPPPRPDLTVQTPPAFSSWVVLSDSATATADASMIYSDQTVYLRIGMANVVAGSTLEGPVDVDVLVDGQALVTLTLRPSELESVYTSAGIALGQLATGSHTLTIHIDPRNEIAESDEFNNIAQRDFTLALRDTTPPTARLKAAAIKRPLTAPYRFTVTYLDNQAINVRTIGKGDVIVTGPKKFKSIATLVSIVRAASDSRIVATYAVAPPGKVWDKKAAGLYSIRLQARQVADMRGNQATERMLGSFSVLGASAPAPARSTTPRSQTPQAPALSLLFGQTPILDGGDR